MSVKLREFLGNLGWAVLAFITLIALTHGCSKACEQDKRAERLKHERESTYK